ncbi:MAG: ribonuclease HI family protein [Gemmataceae bacterium]|nr:ribonuclease HI family protein [Gemmataceae bacterium]
MTQAAPWTIFTDGAARGNPGPAAYAFVIQRPGQPTIEEAGRLGETTNNIAEYHALVRALEKANELGGRRLVVQSDSELIVKQLTGEYHVRHPRLVPLYRRVCDLVEKFESVVFRHVPRSQNRRADQLGNEVLDGKRAPEQVVSAPSPGERVALSPSSAVDSHGPPPKRRQSERSSSAPKVAAVREEALDCLRTAAAAWARGNAADPPVEAVWEQLWDLLRRQRMLR